MKSVPHAAAAASLEAHEPVAPTLAIGLVAGAVGLYLLVVWWLQRYVMRDPTSSDWVWSLSIAILLAVVAAVAAGLPLPWALLAVVIAPALIIAAVERGRLVPPGPAA